MQIAVASPSFSKNTILVQELLSYFPKAKINEKHIILQDKELVEYISGCEAAIIGTEKITESLLQQLPHLKFISKYGVGLDNIDMDACEKYKVKIGWEPGTNKLSVAEMTVGFMISLMHNLFLTSYQQKSGQWNKNGGRQLYGKTIGIIGVGNIGKEVIRLLKPFRCEILVNDIIEQKQYYQRENVHETDKITLIQSSDIVTVHTPLNEEMQEYFNIEKFKLMKPKAFFINTARGKIVVQKDLNFALQRGLISGAAIDVYEKEPCDDAELLAHPNLICTPHIGGNSYEAVINMGRSAINQLLKFAQQNH